MADAVVARAPGSPARRLTAPLTASAILVSAWTYTALANPYTDGFFPSCMWLSLTGHWCPGCGGLRAVHELAHGDVGAALALNPLAVLVIIPLGVILIGAWLRAGWRGHAAPRIPLWVAVALPVVFMVFWVARNIPALEPLLAP